MLGARPLLDSISAASLTKGPEFVPQELSNTAWALSRLSVVHETLMDSISASAIRKLSALSVQDMTNIPWAFAHLMLQADPLMDSISAAVLKNIALFGQPLSAPMLLWTIWKSSLPHVLLRLFEDWSCNDLLLQPEPFGLMLLDNDWWKDVGWELDILDRMHRVLPIRSVHMAVVKLGFVPSLSRSMVHYGLQKVARLVDAVESAAKPGCAESILNECERFAAYKGQWLKVAGLEKAAIIELSLRKRPLGVPEVAAEFGVFVGYTAVRLGGIVAAQRQHVGVLSLEVSPVHVCVARHVLDIGWLAHVGEVKSGQAKDALPLVAEEVGAGARGGGEPACGAVAFAFMDHRGTVFHQDFALLEKSGLFARRAHVVADNTLNPGAPVFLWERLLRRRGLPWAAETAALALTEFLSDHEDWTSVSVRDCPVERVWLPNHSPKNVTDVR